MSYVPWKAVRFTRLSHWLLISFLLFGLFNLSRIPLQQGQVSSEKIHWKRKICYRVARTNATSPDLDLPPDEARNLEGEAAADVQQQQWEKSSDDSESFPYRYLINEEKACNGGIYIINIVPIAPSSITGRSMIRKSWGNPIHQTDTNMKTMFLVGLPHSSRLQAAIEDESKNFHDIIQIEITDSYFNLTLKTLSILHWTKRFCPEASWILKSDEDIFVVSLALKQFLHSVSDRYPKGNTFVCRMNRDLKVCRTKDDCKAKWIIPRDLYPKNYYPPYCNGPGYVISSPLAQQILKFANKTHPFIMEDVYYTGIIARPLHPHYINLKRKHFPSKFRRIHTYHYNGRALFVPDVENDSLALWKKILEYYYNNKTIFNSRAKF